MVQPFTEFFKELQRRLGPEYGLWQEFDPDNLHKDLSTYTHVGTLYVNSSSLNVLPSPMQGVSAQCTLALTMRVKEGQQLSDVIMHPLNVLTQELNGTSSDPIVNGETVTYAITAEYPTSDGNPRDGEGCYFVNVEIPFTIVISVGYSVYRGDNIDLFNNNEPIPLGGVISAVQRYQLTLETSELTNAQVNKSAALGVQWMLSVAAYDLPDDRARQLIAKHVEYLPLQPFTLKYKGKLRHVLVQPTESSERFQFDHVQYEFWESMPVDEVKILLVVTYGESHIAAQSVTFTSNNPNTFQSEKVDTNVYVLTVPKVHGKVVSITIEQRDVGNRAYRYRLTEDITNESDSIYHEINLEYE